MLASRHVVLRGGAKWLLVAGVFSYSAWSMALGLGDITVHSGLNQPLNFGMQRFSGHAQCLIVQRLCSLRAACELVLGCSHTGFTVYILE